MYSCVPRYAKHKLIIEMMQSLFMVIHHKIHRIAFIRFFNIFRFFSCLLSDMVVEEVDATEAQSKKAAKKLAAKAEKAAKVG